MPLPRNFKQEPAFTHAASCRHLNNETLWTRAHQPLPQSHLVTRVDVECLLALLHHLFLSATHFVGIVPMAVNRPCASPRSRGCSRCAKTIRERGDKNGFRLRGAGLVGWFVCYSVGAKRFHEMASFPPNFFACARHKHPSHQGTITSACLCPHRSLNPRSPASRFQGCL